MFRFFFFFMVICLSVLHHGRRQALGVLDVDGLHVRVQLLLGALLVVSLAADAHSQAEGDALDSGFPDLLVQLGVEADILGALQKKIPSCLVTRLLLQTLCGRKEGRKEGGYLP